VKAVKVETGGCIKLPKEMLRLFPTASELAVWTEGEMIVLKRLQPLKPSRIAERVPENDRRLEMKICTVAKNRLLDNNM
jgi:hypothetical protein